MQQRGDKPGRGEGRENRGDTWGRPSTVPGRRERNREERSGNWERGRHATARACSAHRRIHSRNELPSGGLGVRRRVTDCGEHNTAKATPRRAST